LQDSPPVLPTEATETGHPGRFTSVKGTLLEKFLMTRFKMIVLAAGLLAPLPLYAAAPDATPAQGPAMTGPRDGASRHHGGKLLSFLTPEQRIAFLMQAHQEAREQRRTFRREQFQKLAAMSESDRQKFKTDLQARWDALPADRKARIEQRMAERKDRHNSAH